MLTAVTAAEPDAIYHLAALTHVGDSWDDPLRVLEVNVLGTAAVLAAARRCGSDPRVLVTSSSEVYGVVTDPAALPITETAPTAPVTPYAASKLAAEAVCVQAYAGHDQPVIVVRPFNHIGPGQSPTFAVAALAQRIAEAMAAGAGSIAVGNLTARRDFTDVRDVVRAYRLLIESGQPGSVYNVCSGRDRSIQEVADALLRLAGADLELADGPRPRPAGRGAGGSRRPHSAPGGDGLAARDPARSDPRRRAGFVSAGAATEPADQGLGCSRHCPPVRREGSGCAGKEGAQLGAGLASLGVRLLGDVPGLVGESVLEWGDGGLDPLDYVLETVHELIDPRVDGLDGVTQVGPDRRHPLLELGLGVGQPLPQLLALDLGPLEPEHAGADDDVGGVLGHVGDVGGSFRDVLADIRHGGASSTFRAVFLGPSLRVPGLWVPGLSVMQLYQS